MTHDELGMGANRGKKWGAVGAFALMVFCGLIASSCCCDRKPSGTIYLDHGEVFTRERLVNERLNNVNWLNNQLSNTPTASTIQGARFRSETTSTSTGLSAQFNPLGGGSANSYQSAQDSAQIANLQSQIQIAAWQQVLSGLQSNALSYTNVLANIIPTPTSGSGGGGGAAVQSNGTNGNSTIISIVNGAASPSNPSAPGGSATPATPTNSTAPAGFGAMPTNVQLTSVETFQDQLAYRNAVLDEIHEQELDDTHDENGMTLYSINFHLSVAPGNHNKYFGRVSANFSKGEDDLTGGDQYQAWLTTFRKTFDQETMSIQRRYLQNFLTDDEIRELIVDFWKYQDMGVEWMNEEHYANMEDIESRYTNMTNALLSADRSTNFPQWLQKNLPDVQKFMTEAQLTAMVTNEFKADQWQNFLTNSIPGNAEVSSMKDKSTNKPPTSFSYLKENGMSSALGYPTFQKALNDLDLDQKNNISNELMEANEDQEKWETNYYCGITNALDIRFLGDYLRGKSTHSASDLAADTVAMWALSWVVKERYEHLSGRFNRFLILETPLPVSDSNGDFMYLTKVAESKRGSIVFEKAMQRLEDQSRKREFVYAIEPKEYAQNLQDASSQQSTFNLSLGLSATIPQISTSLSAYLDYLKQSQYMLETIKRRPLLTSYMDGNTNFGWLIGGRFKISKDYKLSYEQIALQEGVQVTLEVPSWWQSVNFNVTNQWLGSDGKPYSADDDNCNANEDLYRTASKSTFRNTCPDQSDDTNDFTQVYHPTRLVALKPDYNGLTRALMEEADPGYTQPQIYPSWDPAQNTRGYVVQANAPATLLILGQNLWRNPQVFIGSQSAAQASTYSVLPDMQGIVASFPQGVNYPPILSTNTGQPYQVDLRVVTSDGEAVLRDGVTIVTGSAPKATGQGFVTMKTAFGVLGGNISFVLDTNAAPASPVGYQLALSPDSAKPQMVCSVPYYPGSGLLTFTLPVSSAPPAPVASVTWPTPPTPGAKVVWTMPTPMATRVDVWMQAAAGSEPVSVLQGGEQDFVVFNDITNSQFAAPPTSVPFTIASPNPGNILTIGLHPVLPGTDPTLFWKAYPGLQVQLQGSSGNIELLLTNTIPPPPATPVTATLNGGTYDAANQAIQFNLGNSSNFKAITKSFGPALGAAITCNGGIAIPNTQWSIVINGNIILMPQ